MAPIKSQNSNMLLAFLTLLGVIAIVAVVGSSCSAKVLNYTGTGSSYRISRFK